jgi:hypothetical protein
MFSDLDELGVFGFEFDQTVVLDLDQRTACEFCYTDPAPHGHYRQVDLARWARTKAARSGSYFQSARCTAEANLRELADLTSATSNIPLPEGEISCLVYDSQLHTVVALPDRLLIPLSRTLSDDQREFVQDILVVRMCDVCRCSPHADGENADTFIERIINLRCAGSPDVFANAFYHGLARQVAGLIHLELIAQGA